MQAFAPANGRNSNKTQEEVVQDSGSHPIWQSPPLKIPQETHQIRASGRKGLTFPEGLSKYFTCIVTFKSHINLVYMGTSLPYFMTKKQPQEEGATENGRTEGRKKVCSDWAGPSARRWRHWGFHLSLNTLFLPLCARSMAPRPKAFLFFDSK